MIGLGSAEDRQKPGGGVVAACGRERATAGKRALI